MSRGLNNLKAAPKWKSVDYFGPPDASKYLAGIGLERIANGFSDFSDFRRGFCQGAARRKHPAGEVEP
jgi:hypothetical protein